jgi:hypothetical protein
LATKAELQSELDALIDAAPGTLDTLNEIAAALGDDPNFATTITNSVAGKAPLVHTHVIADVTGLDTALAGKQPVGSYSLVGHGHVISDVSGLQTALDGKQVAGSYAASVHSHVIADVTGLQTALDGKQASGSYVTTANFTWTNLSGKPTTFTPSAHSHVISDVTGLQSALDGKQASLGFTPYNASNPAGYITSSGSISGNAATASVAGTANRVGSFDGDRSAATKLPTSSGQSVRFDFCGAGSTGTGGNYAGVMTYAPWTGDTASTGDASYQLAFGSTAANGGGIPMLNIRKGIDSTWNSWYTLYHSGNFDPANYLPKTGGTINGTLAVNGNVELNDSAVVQRGTGGTSGVGCYYSFQDSTNVERGWVGFGRGTTTMDVVNNLGQLWLSGTTVLVNGRNVLSEIDNRLPLTGGNLTGALSINSGGVQTFAGGVKWDEGNVRSWSMFPTGGDILLNSGDGGGSFSANLSGGVRSPIFYDSNDTSRYIDPNSGGCALRTSGYWLADTTDWAGDINGKQQYHANSWYLSASNRWIFRASSGAEPFTVNQGGTAIATGDLRAPIIYDNNDTAYYVDPNGGSVLNTLTLGGRRTDNAVYYQGFTLDANTMDGNSTGFTYAINAPFVGPIVRLGDTNYSMQLNAPYGANGYGLAFRTRNGDAGVFNPWQYPAIYNQNGAGVGAVYGSIFYDSGNTAYYLDPAAGFVFKSGGSTFEGTDSGLFVTNAEGTGASVRCGAAYGRPGVYSNTSMHVQSENQIEFWTQNGQRGYFDNSANFFANASLRSPILYDSNNTAFYLDASSGGTSLNVAGSIVAGGNITAYSDVRLKENIQTISGALSKVQQLRGVTYTRNDLEDKERRYGGLIAQDVQKVLPEAVTDNGDKLAVDYNATIGLLVEAIKELRAEIETLKSKG